MGTTARVGYTHRVLRNLEALNFSPSGSRGLCSLAAGNGSCFTVDEFPAEDFLTDWGAGASHLHLCCAGLPAHCNKERKDLSFGRDAFTWSRSSESQLVTLQQCWAEESNVLLCSLVVCLANLNECTFTRFRALEALLLCSSGLVVWADAQNSTKGRSPVKKRPLPAPPKPRLHIPWWCTCTVSGYQCLWGSWFMQGASTESEGITYEMTTSSPQTRLA